VLCIVSCWPSLADLSRFPSSAVGANWPFCVDVPLNNQPINYTYVYAVWLVLNHFIPTLKSKPTSESSTANLCMISIIGMRSPRMPRYLALLCFVYSLKYRLLSLSIYLKYVILTARFNLLVLYYRPRRQFSSIDHSLFIIFTSINLYTVNPIFQTFIAN